MVTANRDNIDRFLTITKQNYAPFNNLILDIIIELEKCKQILIDNFLNYNLEIEKINMNKIKKLRNELVILIWLTECNKIYYLFKNIYYLKFQYDNLKPIVTLKSY